MLFNCVLDVMSIVIHKIKGKLYAYDHTRKGNKVITTYLYPVTEGKKHIRRDAEHGGGKHV